MSCWLMKTEPEEFGWDDLVRKGREPWTGVRNPVARNHLASARPGDEVLFYHTGKQRQVVGLARVVSDPYPDPTAEMGTAPDSAEAGAAGKPGAVPISRWVCVDVEPVRAFPRPVTLDAIKGDEVLRELPIVRQGRLSVCPVTPGQRGRFLELAGL